MRYLYYTNYQSGRSGLSNGIMSIEIGVVLAHLTNRFLVLDGDVSPPANIVAYDGRVDNGRRSRVTDLIDIPVPWAGSGDVDLQGLDSLELTNLPLWQFAFHFPGTLDLSSADARSFARGRDHWITVTGEHDRIPVLRLSEEPLVPGTQNRRSNLGNYAYQFHLDDENRRSVYRLLQRMQAKRPFADLARRVASDLGAFNAIHLRRGDFKVTYGVTTLDRKPCEAIEAMDQVFARSDPLVIVTDDRSDPFFTEIKLAYPHHYFVDWHILDEYGAEFAQLPRNDSLSLACLSQLVAAESKEFIGTMTSTFTGMIQRYRGNRGKNEAFRYLWNELPEPGAGVERGRHAVSDCIPLDRGVMIEQFDGPYSWNRVSQLLNPAWMREWPESFLTPETIATGALPTRPADAPDHLAPQDGGSSNGAVIHVGFENLQVAIRSADAAVVRRLAPGLGARTGTQATNVIANLEVSSAGSGWRIKQRGRSTGTDCDDVGLPWAMKRQIATIFALARRRYSWLQAAALARSGLGVVVAGDTGGPSDSLLLALEKDGWVLQDRDLFAIRVEDLTIVPLGARVQPEGAAAQAGRVLVPFAGLAVAARVPLHVMDTMSPLAPAAAVAAIIGASLDIDIDRTRAVTLLCRLLEQRPAVQLRWSNPQQAARLLSRWADAASRAEAQ